MAGHMSFSEVARYTRAADRRRMVRLLVDRDKLATHRLTDGTHFVSILNIGGKFGL